MWNVNYKTNQGLIVLWLDMHLCRKTTYTFSKTVPSGTFKGCGKHMKCSKKYVWIGFFFCLILGSLSHFFYQWSGNTPAVGLFSPVNESAWEHMKLVFFPVLLYAISGRLFLKNAPRHTFARLSSGTPCRDAVYPCLFLYVQRNPGLWRILAGYSGLYTGAAFDILHHMSLFFPWKNQEAAPSPSLPDFPFYSSFLLFYLPAPAAWNFRRTLDRHKTLGFYFLALFRTSQKALYESQYAKGPGFSARSLLWVRFLFF